MTLVCLCLWVTIIIASGSLPPILGRTDSPDVSALNVMYSSMNSPSKLTDWKSSGGDPCGDGWKGVTCSDSSVTEIRLSGLGLTGSMGYQLSSLTSVTQFDLSNNNLQGDIPYQLPPNVVNLNLAKNKFTGGVPYSISQMTDLKYLNLAHNQLNGQLSDMFGKLPNLDTMDLSFNHLAGNLPQSFSSLKGLKALHLQNNQFTGTINVLANLALEELYIENNHFSGWIPNQLKDSDLRTEGNSWSSGPAPPHFSKEDDVENRNGGKGRGGISTSLGVIIGVFLLLLVVVGILLAFLSKKRRKLSSHFIDEESIGHNISSTPLVSQELKGLKFVDSSSSIDMKASESSPPSGSKPHPSDLLKTFDDNGFVRRKNSRRSTDPVTVTVYKSTELLSVAGNFGAGRLLGEGTMGKVYKAIYPDGKMLAVKKIDLPCYGISNSDEFMEVISVIIKLHHPNVTELVGYCSEPDYHLLAYDFQRNGSLHDFLHLSDEYSKPLTWDTRVRIALGTARAIEYLHEVCSPSSIHKNIKSANILLDAELNPRLSDCGLKILFKGMDKNLGPGYNPPECCDSAAYTVKSDVYSFGVVMLELLTGRMPYDSSKQRAEQSLVRWATPQLHDIDSLTKMVDPALRGLYPPKSLSRFADVIALCVQSEPEFRPAISEVVQALVRCVQRPSINKWGADLSSSRQSDASDGSFY